MLYRKHLIMDKNVYGYFVLLQVLLVSPVLCDPGYYDDIDEGWAIGIVLTVIIIPFLLLVAGAVALCFFCACCCFSGRRVNNNGQVFTHPQVVSTIPQPQYQHQPPTMIYQQGSGPNAQSSIYYQHPPGQQYPPEQKYPNQP